MKPLSTSFMFLLTLLTTWNLNAQYYYSDDGKISLSPDSTVLYVEFEGSTISPLLNVGTIVEFFPSKGAALVDASAELVNEDYADVSVGYRLPDGYRMWATRKICVALKIGVDYSELLNFILESTSVEYLRGGYYLIEFESSAVAMERANLIYESGIAKFSHVDFYTPIERYQDPLFPQQFQMHNTGQTIDGYVGQVDCDVDALEAWGITTGSSDIIVSVIDDGMEEHTDFNDASGNSRLIGGYTPANGGNGTPNSDGEHGVACAGIISASHDGVGVMGVSPLSKMLSVNIFSGGETTSDLAEAFTWSVDNGADVISNSWGYTSCSASFSNITAAINDAATNGRDGKGCVIVFASGNNNFPCVTYPGKLPAVIAVGAVTNQGQRSWYSNYGSELDLVAPSNGKAGVRTTDRMGSAGYSFTNYTNSFGGTSAACPVVSGVAALALAIDPNLTSEDVYGILTETADDMGSSGFDNQYAYGRVNALATLECVLDTAECSPSGGGGNPIPDCDPTSLVSLDFVSDVFATISWESVDDAVNYSLRYRESGTNGWSVKAYIYDTNITLWDLTPSTQYEFQIVTNCGGSNISPWTPLITFITEDGVNFDSDSYCESYGQNSANGYIDFFSLGNVTNVSGDDGGYSFYGDEIIYLEQYEDYYVSYSKETPSTGDYMYFSFYIDYDGSYTFDSDELVYQVRKRYNSIYAAPISISGQTILGLTMMRVIAKKGSYASPCEIFSVGEVEDYVVFITGDVDVSSKQIINDADLDVFPNPTTGEVFLDSEYEFTRVNVYDAAGRILDTYEGGTGGVTKIDVSNQSSGMYILELLTDDGIFIKKVIKN